MSNNYLAVTIGPIYKTMMQARRTRELWSVSFTFSRLMFHLIKSMPNGCRLISPSLDVTQPLHGSGVYPDRSYFAINKILEPGDIEVIKSTALTSFFKETGVLFLESAYKIYFVQITTSINPISLLNKSLDGLELEDNYSPSQLLDFNIHWNNKDKKKSKDFFQNLYNNDVAFAEHDSLLPTLIVNENKNNTIKRFPSIPEISTNEFAKKDEEKYWSTIGYQGIITKKGKLYFSNLTKKSDEDLDDEEKIIASIKSAFKNDFLNRHKYFSIIHADGDNVGKLISAMEANGADLHQLSTALNSFTDKAVNLLVEYGAFPVYSGGDDLLFFAPVANSLVNDNLAYRTAAHGSIFGNNLFFLLSKLNEIFKKSLSQLVDNYPNIDPVSLSFGVNVGYYKHPMKEILTESSRSLLYAKKQPGKNHIAIKVQKHSGKTFDFGFKQEGELYENFLSLSAASNNGDDKFLNSVMYKLEDQKNVIAEICDSKEALKLFFDENFNEEVHGKYADFFSKLVTFTIELFKESNFPKITDTKSEEQKDKRVKTLEATMDKMYSALRFVHFLNAKDSDDE